MTLNYIFGIITGTGLGSIITLVIKYYLDKSRTKAERYSNLQKEIFFNLQKQAESVFLELNIMTRQVVEIRFWLNKKNFTIDLTISDINETIKRYSSIQVYFSKQTLMKIDELQKIFLKIVKIYTNVGKALEITQEQCDEVNPLYDEYDNTFLECKSLILKEIERVKEEIM